MKKTILLLALAFSVPAFADSAAGGAGGGSGSGPAKAVVAPTPTPTPTPVPSIVLSDGNTYTGVQIEKTIKELQQRVQELTNERNGYLGQLVDLSAQLQKLQQPPAK